MPLPREIVQDYADSRGLSVAPVGGNSHPLILTRDDFIRVGVMPEAMCCVECHAEEIFGCRIPENDSARDVFYNGIHDTGDDKLMIRTIYLVDGYSFQTCCGGSYLLVGRGTEDLRGWIRRALETA